MTRVSVRTLENGLQVTVVEEIAYSSIPVTEARRYLVKEALQPAYMGKSLVDVKLKKEPQNILSRRVINDVNLEYQVLDVAEMWALFNPDQFEKPYFFRRVLMGEDQRNFMKCEALHAYPSLEFRRCQRNQSTDLTFKPMLSSEDLLKFFTSPFFSRSSLQPEKGPPYKLCLFEEDIVEASAPGFDSQSAHVESWPKLVTACMHTLKKTRDLMQHLRDAKNEDTSHQVKRRRIESIKQMAAENVLGGLADVNVEMYELLIQEQKE